jgi:hypothetical protein
MTTIKDLKTETTEAFLARGGKITICPPANAKGLASIRYYGLFGGKRAYAAGLARRAATGDSSDKMFTSISVPFVKGLAVK